MKKYINILFAVMLLLLNVISVFIDYNDAHAETPVSHTVTFYSNQTYDYNYGYAQNATYEYAWNETTKLNVWTDSQNDLSVGQYYSAGKYWIFRGFVSFDTTTIPADATITSANVNLYCVNTGSNTTYSVVLQNTPDCSANSWRRTLHTISYGNISASSIVSGAYNAIPVSNLTSISRYGTLYIVRVSNDIAGVSTGTGANNSQYTGFLSVPSSGNTNSPYLVVNYTTPYVPQPLSDRMPIAGTAILVMVAAMIIMFLTIDNIKDSLAVAIMFAIMIIIIGTVIYNMAF